MSRPAVSVVVPFSGDVAQALMALALLRSLSTHEGDQRILADNAGTAPDASDVTVVRAPGERSPAHARNAGAARAQNDWILFLDADVGAPADLLEAFVATPVDEKVGALAGEIEGDSDPSRSLVARYGASRNFLSQAAHLNHPFRPRAAAANLLVRRSAFEAVGGFREGLRAAEDTDFCWRLQEHGWRLELRAQARVVHRYRGSLGELRRQWRAYAAGRAWLAREYPGFHPQPAAARVLRRAPRALPRGTAGAAVARGGGRLERYAFLAIDALLAVEELIGLRLSNRP